MDVDAHTGPDMIPWPHSRDGASRIEVPLPVPTVNKETHTTRWDAGELFLEVSGRPCRDSMSGESFESTVVITTRTETLHGCGRALH